MASFAEDSAWDVLGLADPSKPLCLEVQQPMARYLADGSKTVETRRYELPSWATNVEVAVLETKDEPGLSTLGEAPDQGAVLLVGFVVFESCFEYDSEKAFDGDAAKHRIDKTDDARGWDGSPMYGWVVSKAQFCDLPPSSPPLARRHKGFYEAQGSGVAQVRGLARGMYGGRSLEVPSAAELAALATKMAEDAGAAYESGKPVFTIVAGGKAAQIPVATLKELPHTPAEGKHTGKLGASMGALIASCPGEFLSLALTCSGAVFTSRDDDPENPEEALATLPISSKDLMKGILLHTEADGETPVRGGPLRLTFPWNCAMQPIKGLGDAPVDLPDCVLLQIKP